MTAPLAIALLPVALLIIRVQYRELQHRYQERRRDR